MHRLNSLTARILISIWLCLMPAPLVAQDASDRRATFHLSDALASSDLRRPSVRTFQAESSGRVFRIDQTDREQVLMQIDGLREVWALRLVDGARGDRLYLNDVGREMLKITSFDGVTVYPRDNPMGDAAYELGLASPIKPPSPPAGSTTEIVDAFVTLLGFASTDQFQTVWGDAVPGRWEADALGLLYESVVIFGRTHRINPSRLGINRLRVLAGEAPDIEVNDAELTLTVVPSLGFAGRPSSERIHQALRDAGLPRG
jgi:hypothetical protein